MALPILSLLWILFTAASVSAQADLDGSERQAEPVGPGPAIADVRHTPALPGDQDPLVVTATVRGASAPLKQVTLHYRVMYGEVVDVPMFDDGAHGDRAAGDDLYGGLIPDSVSEPGDMVRYYITAEDTAGRTTRWPSFEDPDGSPEYLGTIIADPGVTSALPVFYWFVEHPQDAETREGTRVSVFFDGVFYDNVEAGIRGESSIVWPKRNFKFDFNRGHHFRFSPDHEPAEEIRINSTYSDKSYMRAVLAWETYWEADVPHSISFPVRVERNGEFYSVAHFVEIPETDEYLERQGLDEDGALYKVDGIFDFSPENLDNVDKETREDEDNLDLKELIDGINLSGDARKNYLFDNLNIPEVVNYLAASVIIHDNEHLTRNLYLYRDTEGTGEWMILPWDKDLTFGRNYVPRGMGNEELDDRIWADRDPQSHPLFGDHEHRKVDGHWSRLVDALYHTPPLREMYLRRLRTLMDTLLQPPGTSYEALRYEQRIDDLMAQLQSDVALDQARWPQWGTPETFSRAVERLKTEYLATRRIHLYQTHGPSGSGIIPEAQPATASVRFGVIEWAPASGNADEEFITLVNPNDYAVDISGWRLANAVEHVFAPGTVIPSHGTLYVSPNVVAFRRRAVSPRGGEGHFVQGDYARRLSGSSGILELYNARDALVDSVAFQSNESANGEQRDPVARAGEPTQTSASPQRYFTETGYEIEDDAIWEFFRGWGGLDVFGYPVSRAFTLLGCKVQIFQRQVVQICPGQRPAFMNVLDSDIFPYTHVNFSTFPGSDEELRARTPKVGEPEYDERMLQFVREVVPDVFEGVRVNFAQTYFGLITTEAAGTMDPGILAAVNLQAWGAPISLPVRDPNNANFVYQRFQRGIMHHDTRTGITRGVLLGDYLKQLLMDSSELPPDLREQARGSRFFAQYCPGNREWLCRPEELPGTDLTFAFDQG